MNDPLARAGISRSQEHRLFWLNTETSFTPLGLYPTSRELIKTQFHQLEGEKIPGPWTDLTEVSTNSSVMLNWYQDNDWSTSDQISMYDPFDNNAGGDFFSDHISYVHCFFFFYIFVKDLLVYFLLCSTINSLWAENMDVLLLQWCFTSVIFRTESRNRALHTEVL